MPAFTILYRSANAVVSHAVDPDAVPAAPAKTDAAHIKSCFIFLSLLFYTEYTTTHYRA